MKFATIRISLLDAAQRAPRHQDSSRKEHWCYGKLAYQVCIKGIKEEVARLSQECLAGTTTGTIH
jgi:hypothetical protein